MYDMWQAVVQVLTATELSTWLVVLLMMLAGLVGATLSRLLAR